MTPIPYSLAPRPDEGFLSFKNKQTLRNQRNQRQKITFLCKTNPICRGQNLLISCIHKPLRKIYIFVESQKQTQFKPNSNPNEAKRTQCQSGQSGKAFFSLEYISCGYFIAGRFMKIRIISAEAEVGLLRKRKIKLL